MIIRFGTFVLFSHFKLQTNGFSKSRKHSFSVFLYFPNWSRTFDSVNSANLNMNWVQFEDPLLPGNSEFEYRNPFCFYFFSSKTFRRNSTMTDASSSMLPRRFRPVVCSRMSVHPPSCYCSFYFYLDTICQEWPLLLSSYLWTGQGDLNSGRLYCLCRQWNAAGFLRCGAPWQGGTSRMGHLWLF